MIKCVCTAGIGWYKVHGRWSRYTAGAVLIAQWMRPCHCPQSSDIAKKLDSIAEMVAVHLVGSTTPGEIEEGDVKRVRQSALAKVKEEGNHSVDDMLSALNSVLYDQLGYRGAGEAYYELNNSFIDQVRILYLIFICTV